MSLFLQTVALILSLMGSKGASTHAQSPLSIPKSFAQLQVEETTEQATDQFLKMGPSNVAARAYLAAHLPPLIGQEPAGKPHVWLNSVRLAGAFQLAEAIPSLAKCIAVPAGTPRGSTLAEALRLDSLPAGKALAQIGEPAIPTLVGILDSGARREKWVAYRALFLIGSTRAIKELRDHLGHETDQELMLEIQKALEGK
jgi:HEAT repeat protein